MISLSFAAQFGQVMGLNQAYYTQEVEKPAVLDRFTNMHPQVDQLNSMRMTKLKEAAEAQAKQAMTGVRCVYMNTTVKPDKSTLQAAADIFSVALDKVIPIEGMVFSFTLQPYPLSLLERMAPAGGNVLGLGPVDGPLVSVLILMYWKNKNDDETAVSPPRGVIEEIDKAAAARGTNVPFKYLNYAFDLQDPIGFYGIKNQEKLHNASRKYDPEGLF
ncbi:hypothetical protein JX266_012752 [Neoarthrinium moseri]|nr:hypothetical protein JX266_012752 [Neoarthrinium moseri]